MTMRLKHVLKFESILNALMHWGFKQYFFIAFGNCAREHSLQPTEAKLCGLFRIMCVHPVSRQATPRWKLFGLILAQCLSSIPWPYSSASAYYMCHHRLMPSTQHGTPPHSLPVLCRVSEFACGIRRWEELRLAEIDSILRTVLGRKHKNWSCVHPFNLDWGCPRKGQSQPYLIFLLEENIWFGLDETLWVINCVCKVGTRGMSVQAHREASDLFKPNGES